MNSPLPKRTTMKVHIAAGMPFSLAWPGAGGVEFRDIAAHYRAVLTHGRYTAQILPLGKFA